MKLVDNNVWEPGVTSLPARGVWIEIGSASVMPSTSCSHSPRGECGLKYGSNSAGKEIHTTSLPARGVWIEIRLGQACRLGHCVTPREGSVD